MANVVTTYHGYEIVTKEDFGGKPFLIDGEFVMHGYIAVKDGCNTMPGAIWFQTVSEARQGIDDWIAAGFNADEFWSRRTQAKKKAKEAGKAECAECKTYLERLRENQKQIDHLRSRYLAARTDGQFYRKAYEDLQERWVTICDYAAQKLGLASTDDLVEAALVESFDPRKA